MNRITHTILSVAVLALAGGALVAARPVTAQTVIYSTGFENPPFASGSQIVGQDGWIVGAPFLNPAAAVISTDAARTGSQGLQVRGTDMVSSPLVDPFYAVGVYRHPLTYAAHGQTTIVSADVRVNGPAGVSSPTSSFGASIASRISGPNGTNAYEFQIASEGAFYGFDDNLLGGPATGVSGVLPAHAGQLDHWYNMAIASNFSARTVTFLVDGVALGTIPFDDPTYDTQGRASLEVITNGANGGFSPLNYTAQFDNVSVTAVPEPSDLVLCGAGALCLLGGMRKRRKPTARSLR